MTVKQLAHINYLELKKSMPGLKAKNLVALYELVIVLTASRTKFKTAPTLRGTKWGKH